MISVFRQKSRVSSSVWGRAGLCSLWLQVEGYGSFIKRGVSQYWCSIYQNYLESLCKHRLLGPTPRISDSEGLGWGWKICISKNFPGDGDAARLGPHSENHGLRALFLNSSCTLWSPGELEKTHVVLGEWGLKIRNCIVMWLNVQWGLRASNLEYSPQLRKAHGTTDFFFLFFQQQWIFTQPIWTFSFQAIVHYIAIVIPMLPRIQKVPKKCKEHTLWSLKQ